MQQNKKKYKKREPRYRQRTRQPVRREIGCYEILRYYTGNHEKSKRRSIAEYREILQRYMFFIIDKVLEGNKVALPCAMGYLVIIGTKQHLGYLVPHWRNTNKLWNENPEAKKNKQLVYCMNHHTDGVRYSLRWHTKRVYVYNKKFYSFKPCRALKLKIRDLIFDGKRYYVR